MSDQDKSSRDVEKKEEVKKMNDELENETGSSGKTEEKKEIVKTESRITNQEERDKSDPGVFEGKKGEVPISPEQAEGKEKTIEKKVDQQQTQIMKDDDQSHDEEGDKKQAEKHAKEIAVVQDADEQIDKLVKLAVQKDPYMAIKVAKELDNNYVLDKVHDELIEDKTRKILLEKGLLEE